MKKLILISAFLTVTTTANAQILPDWHAEISVSPYSMNFWGSIKGSAKITASYGMFEIVGLHMFKSYYSIERVKQRVYGNAISWYEKFHNFSKNYFAIFINPIEIQEGDFTFRGGIGYFFNEFPTKQGTHINFQAQLIYMPFDNIGIKYSHISNGFKLFNMYNPGLDNISLVIRL